MRRMKIHAYRIPAFLYGLTCYALASGGLAYAGFFLANAWVPKTVDSGTDSALLFALLVNSGLVALFGLQHSIMARPAFKRGVLKVIPEPIERSTYVLAVALVLFTIFYAWQPMPAAVWTIESPAIRGLLWGLYSLGWLLTFASTFMHNHFDLMGVRQVWRYLQGKPAKPAPFRERALYKHIRHPMMLGLLIVFWATPDMSQGHLLFAAGMTLYIFIGVAFEERDLLRTHGESYARFRATHPMLIPRLRSLFPGTSRPRN